MWWRPAWFSLKGKGNIRGQRRELSYPTPPSAPITQPIRAPQPLEPLADAGKTVVIPPRKSRKTPRAFDKDLYKARHLIENFFDKLKQFRAIATRYDKTARCFLAGIHLVAALIWLN